ncbi:unnamed protein product [Rhodiola kirilowii]
MALKVVHDLESTHASLNVQHEFWPLRDIDSKKAKFPCCLVWTPLPVVSWLAPYIGHVGICREDGSILDFSGSYFVNVDDFAFGSVARYLQLDREKCCFPPNLSSHKCKLGYKHAENGSALTWDDALQSSVRQYQSKSYNIFICNLLDRYVSQLCEGDPKVVSLRQMAAENYSRTGNIKLNVNAHDLEWKPYCNICSRLKTTCLLDSSRRTSRSVLLTKEYACSLLHLSHTMTANTTAQFEESTNTIVLSAHSSTLSAPDLNALQCPIAILQKPNLSLKTSLPFVVSSSRQSRSPSEIRLLSSRCDMVKIFPYLNPVTYILAKSGVDLLFAYS